MILVFGRSGQLARELSRRDSSARFLGREDADLADPAACAARIRATRPTAVINAAAYTAVDRAEEEEALATIINGDSPGAMAGACAELGIPILHISTDYVFDGAGEKPFAPGDPVAPLGAYARSKLAGELAVRDSGARHMILRTSWVFSAHGTNFVKTMLRLAQTRERLSIVADQVGGPTPAADLAQACLALIGALQSKPAEHGTYHYSGAPDISWADFAREIFRQAGKSVVVEGIPSSAYPTPAGRPLNSRLDCSALSEFGLSRPDWKAGLTHVLTELEKQ